MKHLKSFNESAGDLAGKKPKGMSNDAWDILKKMLNRGFVKSYTFENIGWTESNKLTALDDLIGVFDSDNDKKKKILKLLMLDNSVKEIEFIEKEDFKNVYPKNAVGGPNYTQTPTKVPYKHYVPVDDKEFQALKYASADYVQTAKKSNKTILDPNNLAHPNEKIKELLKKYSKSYNNLICNYGYVDVTTIRQAKNGSVELANRSARSGNMIPFYTIVKTGKIYNKLNHPVSTIYTTPPLMTVADYERCFDFLVKREENLEKKRITQNRNI